MKRRKVLLRPCPGLCVRTVCVRDLRDVRVSVCGHVCDAQGETTVDSLRPSVRRSPEGVGGQRFRSRKRGKSESCRGSKWMHTWTPVSTS